MRSYPLGDTAAHLLGYLQRHDDSQEGEDTVFNYRIPDFQGAVGVEYGFDDELRGRAGAESLLVNSQGYRQSETIDTQPEPGQNVVLTIDLDLQRAAEASLAKNRGADARAAVVVMDVRNGDVLAMASSPTINPLYFTGGLSPEEMQREAARRADMKLRPEINRATQENYAPGSIFKVIVGLAALEAGLNPEKFYDVEADPETPGMACITSGTSGKRTPRRPANTISSARSSDPATRISSRWACRAGIEPHRGARGKISSRRGMDLPTRQETGGNLPTSERIHEGWSDGDTANLCIGQGEVAVTPLQMAVVYSAIANGGTVFWPRLVSRIEPQDPTSREAVTNFPSALVRDRIGVSARSLQHFAQRDARGNRGCGRHRQGGGGGPGLQICGKTGTAQVQDSANRTDRPQLLVRLVRAV